MTKIQNIVVYFAKFLYAIYAVAQRWMKKLLAGHLVALLVIVIAVCCRRRNGVKAKNINLKDKLILKAVRWETQGKFLLFYIPSQSVPSFDPFSGGGV